MSRLAALAAAIAVPALALVPTSADAGKTPNTVTAGVAKLAWPAVSLDYERRLARKVGVGGFVGFGRYNPKVFNLFDLGGGNPFEEATFKFREVGLRANLYAIGGFKHGMVLGLTVHNRRLSYEEDGAEASVAGTIIGPHIGYKLITSPGFTLGFLGGIGYHAVGDIKVESGDNSATLENPLEEFPVMTFGSINAGWSF